MEDLQPLIVATVLTAMYFAPSIVAALRKMQNIGSVIVVNFFLGWTFIGWVVALAMALGARTTQTQIVNHTSMAAHHHGYPQPYTWHQPPPPPPMPMPMQQRSLPAPPTGVPSLEPVAQQQPDWSPAAQTP